MRNNNSNIIYIYRGRWCKQTRSCLLFGHSWNICLHADILFTSLDEHLLFFSTLSSPSSNSSAIISFPLSPGVIKETYCYMWKYMNQVSTHTHITCAHNTHTILTSKHTHPYYNATTKEIIIPVLGFCTPHWEAQFGPTEHNTNILHTGNAA